MPPETRKVILFTQEVNPNRENFHKDFQGLPVAVNQKKYKPQGTQSARRGDLRYLSSACSAVNVTLVISNFLMLREPVA